MTDPSDRSANADESDAELREHPSLRILLFADFRSPHALGMARGLREAGHTVLCVSSEAVSAKIAEPPKSRLSHRRVPLAAAARGEQDSGRRRLLRRLAGWHRGHTLLALVLLPTRRRQLHEAIRRFAPDIVHGLRVPFEGLTVLSLRTPVRRVVSTWGSDFEPTTRRDVLLRAWVKAALPRAAGIHVDSMQDRTRALSLGLDPDSPWIYGAANFGVDRDLFHARDEHESGLVIFARRPSSVINYRGFVMASLQLRARPQVRIVGASLREVASELHDEFGESVAEAVELLPRLDQTGFAELLRKAHVVVSPSLADGTPITVVEALACGSRVVAGRLPQLEALNQPSDLLVLVDATDADAIAEGIERCLENGVPQSPPALPTPFSRSANEFRFTAFYDEVLRHRR